MKAIKPEIIAATFDVWETLIKDNPQLSERRTRSRVVRMADVLQHKGFSTNVSHVRETYDNALIKLEDDIWSRYLDVGTRGQLQAFLSVFDPHLDASNDEQMLAELEDAYTTPLFDFPPALAPNAREALEAVQRNGLLIGLVCNTGVTPGRDIRRLLDGYGILKYFRAVAFSDEEGLRKPRREIFQRTLSLLGVSPQQSVHIGDDAIADIAGAKGVGMRAIMVRAALPLRLTVLPDARIDDLAAVPETIDTL